jgi:hypothetical protein
VKVGITGLRFNVTPELQQTTFKEKKTSGCREQKSYGFTKKMDVVIYMYACCGQMVELRGLDSVS